MLLRTIAELAGVGAWTVMVQREIADRLRAEPGLADLRRPERARAARLRGRAAADRGPGGVQPRPRVDSALLGLTRRGRGSGAGLARLVREAFAHRRKPLAGSLELAGGPLAGRGPRGARRDSGSTRTRGPRRSRRRTSPALAARLERRMTLRAPAKLNLCLYLGGRRADGLHEIRSLFCPLTLADRIAVTEAERDEVVCPGVEGPNLATAALDGLRARGWAGRRVRVEIEKRIPVAAGLGGGSADAAAVLRLAGDEVDGIGELAAELGRGRPVPARPGASPWSAAPARWWSRCRRRATSASSWCPRARGSPRAEVYAETDRLGLGRDPDELDAIAAGFARQRAGGASPLDYAELLVNDLAQAALLAAARDRRRARGARRGGRGGRRW